MGRIENLIAEDFTLDGNESSRYIKTVEHDSLVIDREKQIFYWNSKNISGTAFDWLTKVKGLNKPDAVNKLKKLDISITGDLFAIPAVRGSRYGQWFNQNEDVVHEKLLQSFFEYGKNHREYWREKRGYKDSTIDRFRLGYTGYWYTIPFIVEGKLRNFQCRTPDKKLKSWYSGIGPLPFNVDRLKYTDWAVLTEGPVDAIMLEQEGIPAISSNSGAYFHPTWMNYIANLDVIYVVFDNDDAGRKGVRKVKDSIGNLALMYTFDGFDEGYDVTDFFMDGGSSDRFMELLKEESKR